MRSKSLSGNVGYYYDVRARDVDWYCHTIASHDTYKHWSFRAVI